VTAKRAHSRPDEEAAPEGNAAEQAGVPLRFRVADRVFEVLLGAILRGELEPGEHVPTQRALSREFRVSPLLVRHAIHRLEELQLVRVRQGSPTIVLDPQHAADVRLIQMQLEVALPGDALELAGIENRALSALPLLVLAARRITDDELAELVKLVDRIAEAEPTQRELADFEAEYWNHVARATQNPVLAHQVRWWFHTLRGLRNEARMHLAAPIEHYRELNETLRSGHVAADIWMAMLNKVFDWTEAQPGHALRATAAHHENRRPRNRFAPVVRGRAR
jgi:GntR family transcriptional repressor for pyruvate dehydrogenase complex